MVASVAEQDPAKPDLSAAKSVLEWQFASASYSADINNIRRWCSNLRRVRRPRFLTSREVGSLKIPIARMPPSGRRMSAALGATGLNTNHDVP